MTHAVDDTRATTESRLTYEGELLARIGSEGWIAVLRAIGMVASAPDADALCASLTERGLFGRSVELALLARVDPERGLLSVLGASGALAQKRARWIPVTADHPMARAIHEERLVEADRSRGHAVDVALPLSACERVVGVLGLRWSAASEVASLDRAQLLLLGAQLGPVLDRLIAKARERDAWAEAEASMKRLLGTARISRELAEAAFDERELLDRAARGIADVFGGACLVRMLDGATRESVAVDDPALRSELEQLAAVAPASAVLGDRAAIVDRPHRRLAGVALRKSSPVRCLMSAPITSAGTSRGVILVVRSGGPSFSEEERLLLADLSYRIGLTLSAARAFQAQQEARERAEEATRGRDRVLSIVTHDLRAPLATVHLASSLLGEMDPDHEGFADLVQRIGRATTRMRRLVDDLLDLGQLESGALRVRQRRVPILRVLEETVDELSERAQAACKTLVVRAVSAPIDALGDYERLQQLLVNLVVNAIDHTPRGTRIVLGAARDGDRARVWVEDDGPGLDPDVREHLFEPRVRGAHATVHGAGLGLWIAKGLVEAHGGTLSVESTPGSGTRFELSLPLAPGSG